MKSIKLLGLLILGVTGLTYGQNADTIKKTEPPLYVLISSQDDTVMAHGIMIDPQDISAIAVLKGPAATQKYGAAGEHGVVVITFKGGPELYDLNALKQLYDISEYKTVNIFIDGVPNGTTDLVIARKEIKDVKKTIVKKNEEVNLYIITNHPAPKPVPGSNKILIRG